MTRPDDGGEMRVEAVAIVESWVQRLLDDDDNRDLRWVPGDFAERVAGLAWEHQFDLDGTVFRRELRRYLTEISKAASS